MFIWFVVGLIVLLVLIGELYVMKTGVQTTASFPSAQKLIVQQLQAEAGRIGRDKSFTIIDLGSGNGQLARRIACEIPTSLVKGVELSIVPWCLSIIRQKLFGPANLGYDRKDFWQYDVSKYDAVVIFLTDNVIARMSEKLWNDLPVGRLVISNETALMGGWVPLEVIDLPFWKSKVFVYRR